MDQRSCRGKREIRNCGDSEEEAYNERINDDHKNRIRRNKRQNTDKKTN